MIPWCVSVEIELMTVASCPPPGVPVETNTPANLPTKPPVAQSPPVLSQKTCRRGENNTRIRYLTRDDGQSDMIDKTHLPLRREITITSRNTEQEGVKLCQLLDSDDGVVWFRRGLQFGEDFCWEGLWDSRCAM